jgi:hypothetical protein
MAAKKPKAPASKAPFYQRPYAWAGTALLAFLLILFALSRPAPAPPAAPALPPGRASRPAGDAVDTDTVQTGGRDRTAAAYRMAKLYISRTLRHPDLARYPEDMERRVVQVDEGLYRVTSHVDAPNEMGESVRVEFVVEVRHVSGDNWQLAAMELDGKKVY